MPGVSPSRVVSVIVPLCNALPHLPACIQSVMDQTFTAWELILIDDGSTDGSGELCEAYAQKDPRIRVIHQENRGVSAARNQGIRAARGSYTCFMDSDDSIEPSLLANMVEVMETTGAGCITCGMTYDFAESGVSRSYTVPEGLRNLPLRAHEYRELSENRMLNSHCGKLFRKAILDSYSILMDESISVLEDGIFVLDYLFHAKTLYCLPTASYHYRQTAAPSLQKRYHPEALTAWVRYAQKHIRFTEHMGEENMTAVYIRIWRHYRRFLTDIYAASGLPSKEKYRLTRTYVTAAHDIGVCRHTLNTGAKGKLVFFLVKHKLPRLLHFLLLLRHTRKS